MADANTPAQPVEVSAAAPSPVAGASASPSTVAPVAESPPADAAAAIPVTTEQPVAAAPAKEPSAVEAAPAAETPAPAEGAAPATEAAAEPAKPAAPTYTEFKMPEGIAAAPDQISAYTNVLGKYGISQEAGQELLDFHATAVKKTAEAMQQNQQDTFAQMRRDWVSDFDKSAGNRRDTVLNDAKWAVTELVKDTKERTELWNVLALTGAGDNKHLINLLAKAAKRMREPGSKGSGLPTNGARNENPADKRYGTKPRTTNSPL
jgi:hypothetical protein